MTVYLSMDRLVIGFDEYGNEMYDYAFRHGDDNQQATIDVDWNLGLQGPYISTDFEIIQMGGSIELVGDIPANFPLLTLASILSPKFTTNVQIDVNGVSKPATVYPDGVIKTDEAILYVPNIKIGLGDIKFLNQEVFNAEEAPPMEPDPINPLFGTIHAFTAGELLNGATIYGTTWEVPGYRVSFDGIVELFGLIKLPATPNSLSMFKLPAGIAPLKQRIFTVQIDGNTVQARLDIQQSGDAVLRCSGATNPNFLSLEGISFRIDPLAV